jgi:hypothetical protein
MCHVATCRNLVRDDKPCRMHGSAAGWGASPSPSATASHDPEYRRNRPKAMARDAACRWCGKEAQSTDECDHITPVALGGGNDLDNLCRACVECNQRRGRETREQLQRARRAC